jgi:hypothetical protein
LPSPKSASKYFFGQLNWLLSNLLSISGIKSRSLPFGANARAEMTLVAIEALPSDVSPSNKK